MHGLHGQAQEFLRQVLPLIARHDDKGLDRVLSERYAPAQLASLLASGSDDVAKTAAVCLSLTGDPDQVPALTELLGHDDATVAGYAENALWSIWFRGTEPAGNDQLEEAVRLVSEADLSGAIDLLEDLIDGDPDFPEAHNQLAVALFLAGDYARAITHCRTTLQLNRYHFGAMAGMGHCYASLGRFDQAIQCYRCALQLNPRLDGIRQAMATVRKAARRQTQRFTLDMPQRTLSPEKIPPKDH